MENLERYRVPVTDTLKSHIVNLRNGQTWRALRDELPGWKWSHSLLADIASGKVGSTSLAVYEALGIMSPMVIIAGAGSIIVGSGQGLLSPDQPIVYIAIPPEEWKRHSTRLKDIAMSNVASGPGRVARRRVYNEGTNDEQE
jgi:hypothetical protein